MPVENNIDTLDEKSTEELYAILQEIDPNNVHHPNQRKKILSDIRLYNQTKVPPSQLRQKQNAARNYDEQLDNLVIWLSCSSDVLSKRLAKRVDTMVRDGMLEENTNFIKQYFHECDHERGVWQAIGLKEFVPLFKTENGDYNGRETLMAEGNHFLFNNILDLDVKEALAKVITDTEQYAKRYVVCCLIHIKANYVDSEPFRVTSKAFNQTRYQLCGSVGPCCFGSCRE